MTKQHYIVAAEVLQRHNPALGDPFDSQQDLFNCLCECFADAFGEDNPRFNREHFLAVTAGNRAPSSRPPRKREYLN